ncbi:hypothetical protein P171DRAFT_480555 [Karstenula rhodostoma CBS 690.94]|uniref:C3H1-type domain-containing protein n=1 Tax=Karstenula rhodostoma CBS 690.94 TaxID=1392251 RepID=A0A9P4PUB5_9PLEO|nr:hypothetical protein P171DRAFT_480555 [Karstenula rhodostoma CBS 690.94]
MQDPKELAELSDQLQALQVDGADQFRELMVAVGRCAEALKQNAVRHDELLEKHSRLQKNYEVLKAGQVDANIDLAKSAYVIVLIDAHSHKFQNHLVLDKASGGPKAVRLLRDSVKEYIRTTVPDAHNVRIVAQAFANLKLLSTDAYTENLADQQPRSLAPFTSGFSRACDFFDFVDVQDKSTVQNKIKERLKVCVNDPSCKHIFLAAAGSALYTKAVQELHKHKHMITCVKGELPDSDMLGLDVSKVVFRQVFRASPESGGITVKGKSGRICFYHQKGTCHRPNCKFEHPNVGNSTKLLEKCQEESSMAPSLPIVGRLGLVPVNTNNERLDISICAPTKEQWAVYDARTKAKKICSNLHMRHQCDRKPCEFDHASLEPDTFYCLQYIMKGIPCTKGGECRSTECFNGHVCQKKDCRSRRVQSCRMTEKMHNVDLHVSEWVKADMGGEGVNQDGVRGTDDALIDFSD